MNKKTEALERIIPQAHFRVTKKGVPIPDHVKFIRKPLGEREFDAMVCKACCYGCCVFTPLCYCALHQQSDTLIRGLKQGSVPIVKDELSALLKQLQGVWKIKDWSADPSKQVDRHGVFFTGDRCPFTTALVQDHYLVLSGGHKMLKTSQYFDLHGQGQSSELILVEMNEPVESTLCFFRAPDGSLYMDNMGTELLRNDAWGMGEVEIETAHGMHVLWQREWVVAGEKNPDPTWHAHVRALEAAREDSRTDMDLAGEYSDKFAVGEAVEAAYNKTQRRFRGRIAKSLGRRIYDVQFDDGDYEEGIRERFIYSLADGIGGEGEGGGEGVAFATDDGGASRTKPKAEVKVPLRINDRVECLSKGSNDVWTPGIVIYVNVGYNRGDTFDVSYDNGQYENRLPEAKVRRRITSMAAQEAQIGPGGRKILHIGNQVNCDLNGRRAPGRVMVVNHNGSYDVAVEGGELERQVDIENLVRIGPDYRALKRKLFHAGERVEAIFGGSMFAASASAPAGEPHWMWGRVDAADQDNDSYDIKYDGGDFERNIPSARLRRKDEVSHCLDEDIQTLCHGSVTSFARGRGNSDSKEPTRTNIWINGKVATVNRDHSYDVQLCGTDEIFRRVRLDHLRPRPVVPEGTRPVSVVLPEATFRTDDEVDAFLASQAKWHPATVTAARFGGLFDVAFSDGDVAAGLKASDLRWPKGKCYSELVVQAQAHAQAEEEARSRPGSGSGIVDGVRRLMQRVGSASGSRPGSGGSPRGDSAGGTGTSTGVGEMLSGLGGRLAASLAPYVEKTPVELLAAAAAAVCEAERKALDSQLATQLQACVSALSASEPELPPEHALAQGRTLRETADTKARELLGAALGELDVLVGRMTSAEAETLVPRSAEGGRGEASDQRKIQVLTVHLRKEFVRLMREQRSMDVAGAVQAAVDVPLDLAVLPVKTVGIIYRVVSLIKVLGDSVRLEEGSPLAEVQVGDSLQRLRETEAEAVETAVWRKRDKEYAAYREQLRKRLEKEQGVIMANSYYDHLNMEGIKKLAAENLREAEESEVRALNEVLVEVFSAYLEKVVRDHKERAAAQGRGEPQLPQSVAELTEQGSGFLYGRFAKAKLAKDELRGSVTGVGQPAGTVDGGASVAVPTEAAALTAPPTDAGATEPVFDIVLRVMILRGSLGRSSGYVEDSVEEPEDRAAVTKELRGIEREAAVALEDLTLGLKEGAYANLRSSMGPKRDEMVEFMLDSPLYEHMNMAGIKAVADEHLVAVEAEEVMLLNEQLAEVMDAYLRKLLNEQLERRKVVMAQGEGALSPKPITQYKREGLVFLQELLVAAQELREEAKQPITARLRGSGAPGSGRAVVAGGKEAEAAAGGSAVLGGGSHWASVAGANAAPSAQHGPAAGPTEPRVPVRPAVTVREVRSVRPRVVRGASNATMATVSDPSAAALNAQPQSEGGKTDSTSATELVAPSGGVAVVPVAPSGPPPASPGGRGRSGQTTAEGGLSLSDIASLSGPGGGSNPNRSAAASPAAPSSPHTSRSIKRLVSKNSMK